MLAVSLGDSDSIAEPKERCCPISGRSLSWRAPDKTPSASPPHASLLLERACREAVLDLENGTNAPRNDLINMIGIDEDGYYDELFVDY